MKDGLDNIEKVFKETFDSFEANVDPGVWTNIQNAISSGGTASTPNPASSVGGVAKSAILKIAAAVITAGTVVTAGYYIVNDPVEKATTDVVAENTIETNVEDEKAIKTIVPVITETTQEEKQATENQVVVEEEVTLEMKKEEKKSSAATIKEEKVAHSNNPMTEATSVTTENSSTETTETETNTTDVSNVNTVQQETKEKEEVTVPKETYKQEAVETPVVKPVKKEATVNLIPNVITPNGDGKNDVIKITGKNLEKIEVAIMDKTGKPVYRITSLDDEWSGKDQNGFDLLPGIYYMAGMVVDVDGNSKSIKQAINLLK